MLYNEFNKSRRPKIRFSETAAGQRNVIKFSSRREAAEKKAWNVFTVLHFYVFMFLCFYFFVYLCAVFLPPTGCFGSKTPFSPLKRAKNPRKSAFFDRKKFRLVCFKGGGANNFTRFGVKLTVGQIFSGFKGTSKAFGNQITF